MEDKVETPNPESSSSTNLNAVENLSYRISDRPVIDRQEENGDEPSTDLPRSYGTQSLTLMARDPHTLFAYWDIDWPLAFREQPPRQRAVFLRLLDSAGAELASVKVEPMAGNSYVSVGEADTAYRGELGYFEPPETWNKLAASDVVTTPAEMIVVGEEADFATVPFHLSFQHMIDLLDASKQENESLTAMLSELRQSAADSEKRNELSAGERELAQVMEVAAANSPDQTRIPGRSDFWTQQRIERILGIGGSSPTNGFGGSSRAS